ncbi:MAG: phage virion morphogenesis protein [Dechloromonas sp.]|nr:phage virion morphogenesis protein [Dechloromonas sp.]
MADGYSINLADQGLQQRLNEIIQKVGDMSPAMASIGELLSESTKVRFSTSTGPDGARWAPNAPATLLAKLAEISGSFAAYTNLKTRKEGRVRVGNKKGFFDGQGKITQKAVGALASKKPLVDTGLLQDTIRYQVSSDGSSVEIGTNRFSGEWDGGAAVHQFGSKDGDIPARPFLGLSSSDRADVLDILQHFLNQSIR